MKSKAIALSAFLSLITAANASVIYDENGAGFVGKGDIQNLYDWNNSQLQENAALVQFRLLRSGSASWTCTGVNPAGHTVTQSHATESDAVAADVGFDARKNRAGQVTGFALLGAEPGSTSFASVGSCNTLRNWQVQPTLDPDSINYEGSGEPLLQVSTDGELWHDLPISE